MAEHYRFFDSADPINPDRTYNAQEFTDYFKALVTTGVMKGAYNELKVTATGSNMLSVVDSGIAFLEGRYYENDSPLSLEHDTEVLGMNRIDRVVIRLDLSPENRHVKAFIKKGSPSENPIPPVLTRDETTYEISLAQVFIEGGQTYIDSSSITDERGNETICPWAGSKILPNFNDDTLAELTNDVETVKTNITDSQLDIWVDAINGNDLNEGTQTSPFKNLQKALDEVRKRVVGTRTIHLLSGTYSTNLDSIQLNGGLVQIIGEGSDVVIDGFLLLEGGTSNVRVSNVEFSRPVLWAAPYYGIHARNHSGIITIEDYTVGLKNNGHSGINGGILNESSNVTVLSAHINNATGNAIASTKSGVTNVRHVSGTNNNRLYEADGGIVLVSSNNTIEGTVQSRELNGGKVFIEGVN